MQNTLVKKDKKMKITALNTNTQTQNTNNTRKAPSFQAELKVGIEAKKIILEEWEGYFSHPSEELSRLQRKFQDATKDIRGTVSLIINPKNDNIKVLYEDGNKEIFHHMNGPDLKAQDLLPNPKLDGKNLYSTSIRRIVATASDMMSKVFCNYKSHNPFHTWCKTQIPQECYENLPEEAKILEFA